MNFWSNIKDLIDKASIYIDAEEKEYLICGICRNIMVESFQIICGCQYCKKCLIDYIADGNKPCPVGNTDVCRRLILSSIIDAHIDKEINLKILQLTTKCPTAGCNVEASLAEMAEHVKQCAELESDVFIPLNEHKENVGTITLSSKVNLLEETMERRFEGFGKMMNDFESRIKCLEEQLSKETERIDSIESNVEDISTKVNEERNDDFIWKIDNYSTKKVNSLHLYSDPFYTKKNGYKLRLRLDPYQNKEFLSLYFYICKGDNDDILPWPFTYDVTLSVVDQDSQSRDHCKTLEYPHLEEHKKNYIKPETPNNCGYGYPEFLAKSTLESSPYLLRNDTLFIRCSVTKV